MRLHVLAVGERPPSWVLDACADYQQRFPPHCPLHIAPVPAPRRTRSADISRLMKKELELLAARVPKGALTIALERTGRSCTTEQLARRLETWMHGESDVAFLIGGADGLAPEAARLARETWSLSPLTLPHALARVIVVEQLYRAVSILEDHPYHRGG